jgi:hypothetical protein
VFRALIGDTGAGGDRTAHSVEGPAATANAPGALSRILLKTVANVAGEEFDHKARGAGWSTSLAPGEKVLGGERGHPPGNGPGAAARHPHSPSREIQPMRLEGIIPLLRQPSDKAVLLKVSRHPGWRPEA